MPSLAPVITQTVADDFTPCPAGTQVATLSPDPAETDPGPFTYEVVTGADKFAVDTTSLVTTVDLTGSNDVGVTVTGSDATASPETTATITVGDAVEPPPDIDDPYYDNPQHPTPMPEGSQPVDYWRRYVAAATMRIVPHARQGVDFAVGRSAKDEQMENTYWNDALLGARPDAEIEALAKEMAAAEPR